ncbi:cytochrome b [Commensalibacter oyaizuii]|uniref:Cytochrome b n=1 Tax=Commensalibacter oyaizuii TaxID=3043873 RepID=A0ABT6PZR3_9PROT|nr:cytochrome b [Commensalibacter sp. TBRC 16381]MDI2090351.1 cytochrome b [Commensalibacter sp. TBRC 16381]
MNHSYTNTAKILHWLMATLFIFVWCLAFYRDHFIFSPNQSSLKLNLIMLHKNIATTILFLFFIRLFWRYTHPAPKLPKTMPNIMKILAHIMHVFLYIVLLLMPLTGCLLSWSAGRTAPVLYLFDIPAFINKNTQLASILKPIHIYLSWFVGLMIVGHILTALKHHFIDKDTVMKSMLFK